MGFPMTFNTQWDYIELVFFVITGYMVVMLCLHFTITANQRTHLWKPVCFNGICDCIKSYCKSRMFSFYILYAFGHAFFVTICLAILFMIRHTFYRPVIFLRSFSSGKFSFLALGITYTTYFTLASMSIFPIFIFRKFIKMSNLFAFRALFCYDWFRHGFFLTKKLCLEPLQTHYLCGLFYYTPCQIEYQAKYIFYKVI